MLSNFCLWRTKLPSFISNLKYYWEKKKLFSIKCNCHSWKKLLLLFWRLCTGKLNTVFFIWCIWIKTMEIYSCTKDRLEHNIVWVPWGYVRWFEGMINYIVSICLWNTWVYFSVLYTSYFKRSPSLLKLSELCRKQKELCNAPTSPPPPLEFTDITYFLIWKY